MIVRFPLAFALIAHFTACHIGTSRQGRADFPPYRSEDTVIVSHRVNAHHYDPSTLGALVGLPYLVAQRLPPGYRELRIEIGCGVCVPVFLVRLIEAPEKRVHGEAFALWLSADTLAAMRADSAERRRRGRIVDKDREWETAWCVEPARRRPMPEAVEYLNVWCRLRAGPDLDWRALLAQLDSLDAFAVGTDTGYAPTPPGFVTHDTVAGQVRMSIGGGCQDIGSYELTLESLVSGQYRNASFFCLERPRGEEATRLARVRRIALSAIPPLQIPK